MTATTTYTLNDFVADLQQSFASHQDLVGRANAVAAVLEQLLKRGGWVQDIIDTKGYDGLPGGAYTDDTYGHPAPGFHITCGAQKPGQTNAPHDHGAGWVAYGTFEGAIEQTRYGWEYPNGPLDPQLVVKESFIQKPGLKGATLATHNAILEKKVREQSSIPRLLIHRLRIDYE